MAAVGKLPGSWPLLQRKAYTLPVTVGANARGVPITPYLNLDASNSAAEHGHDDHHEPLNFRARRDLTAPNFAARAKFTSLGHIFSRTPLTAPPTLAFQRQFSTSRRTPAVLPKHPVDGVSRDTTRVPDYSPYRTQSEESGKAFSYLMVGSMGLLTAAGAKSLVTDFLANLSASADVLALARVEVEMGNIPEGKNVIIKWRGKPVFIRHRTKDEIDEANSVDVKSLRDPEKDSDRTKRPEWLVMLGVCTHLGCVPIGEAGDYGGWYCPCHGSHYDISGRVRRGPAPLNLEVPEYDFSEDEKLIIG